MKPIYMETSRSPRECADILRAAMSATDEKAAASDCRLREAGGVVSIDLRWQGRLTLGVDLAPVGQRTFVRIRYGTESVVRLAILICWPLTVGAFIVAGLLLPQPLIAGVGNVVLFGAVGLVLAFLETALLWMMLALPALKLMRELGKALGAEEVASPRQAEACAAFQTLQENPSI
jgi:hypothetical protein